MNEKNLEYAIKRTQSNLEEDGDTLQWHSYVDTVIWLKKAVELLST